MTLTWNEKPKMCWAFFLFVLDLVHIFGTGTCLVHQKRHFSADERTSSLTVKACQGRLSSARFVMKFHFLKEEN